MHIYIIKSDDRQLESSKYWYGKVFGGNWIHAKWYNSLDGANNDVGKAVDCFDVSVYVVDRFPTESEVKERETFLNEDWIGVNGMPCLVRVRK